MKKGKIFSLVASLAMVLSLMVMPIKVDAAGSAANAVAKIGDTEYATLVAALENVKDNETIVLVDNVIMPNSDDNDKFAISGTTVFTLDLNGKKVSFEDSADSIALKDTASMTLKDTAEGGLIEGDWPIYLEGDSTFTMESGKIVAKWYGVCGNGSKNLQGTKGTTININGGTIYQNDPSDPHCAAIYHPQKGIINISGGEITGSVGIQLCSGGLTTVNMNGGIVTGTGKNVALQKPENDGCVGDGAAISALNRNYPGGAPNINITAGEFVSEQSESILAYGFKKVNGQYIIEDWATANEHVKVFGGTFTSDVTEYISDEYKAYEQTDGTFKVAPKATNVTLDRESASLEVGKNLTLKATLNPTETLDTVTYTTSDAKVATVDANGKVTGVAVGNATITATANGKTATCEVTVYKVEADVPTIDTSKPVEEVTVGVNTEAKETVTKETETIIADITAGKDVTKVVSEETAAAIKKAVEEGKTIETKVAAGTVKEEAVDKEDVAKVEEKVGTTGQIAQYLDLRVEVMIAGEEAGTINELSKPIKFIVAIPEELQADGREFYVVRVHDGVAEKLETTLNEDGTISFETDKFSTYALVYVDKKVDIIPDQKPEEEPTVKPEENTTTNTTDKTDDKVKTSDDSNTMLYASFAGLALVGGAIVVAMKKKEELLNK